MKPIELLLNPGPGHTYENVFASLFVSSLQSRKIGIFESCLFQTKGQFTEIRCWLII